MPKTNKPNLPQGQRLAVNGFGFFGYLTTLFLWMWMAILYLPLLVESEASNLFLPQATPGKTPEQLVVFSLPPTVSLVVGVVFLIIITILLVVVAYCFPKNLGTQGKKITKGTAKAALPVIARHKQMTKKQQTSLLQRLGWITKIILVAIPLIISVSAQIFTELLPGEVITTISCSLAIIALGMFTMQALLAKSWKFPDEAIW